MKDGIHEDVFNFLTEGQQLLKVKRSGQVLRRSFLFDNELLRLGYTGF